MSLFVAYYRVSTDRQGLSGLGLDAQRSAVATYVANRGDLIAAFTEIESGRKSNRPELDAALELCRCKKSILVIAKLDRLARNVGFIANLIESEVEFRAVDMPDANRLTLHILAAVAKHERETISQRTRAALTAAKLKGIRLGNPNPISAAAMGRAVLKMRSAPAREEALPIILRLNSEGLSLRRIANALTEGGVPPLRGQTWHPETIRKILSNSFG